MTQLTDEMINSSLRGSGIMAGVLAAVFLLIGGVLLAKLIKIGLGNNKLLQNGETIPQKSRLTVLIGNAIAVFLLVIGFCLLGICVQQVSTSSDFTVANQTIVAKDNEVIFRKHSGGKAKHNYYFTLSTLGKKKVTNSRFEKYEENDQIIVILNEKEKIIKIYDADEYQYVGSKLRD